MYNLLITAGSGEWNNPTTTIPTGRYLEYTVDHIRQKYGPLNVKNLHELTRIPCLFAYEKFLNEPARVGFITEINQLHSELRIKISTNPNINPIAPSFLLEHCNELDIEKKFELSRTHWAIKDIDLEEILRINGIISADSLQVNSRPPKVFVSYSWDSPEHKQWVAQLCGHLRQHGIDITLDQWHLRLGEDMGAFMEKSIREADRVLVICTESYVAKTRARKGGAGYEHMILTGEMMQNLGTTKFIPVIKQSNEPIALPAELQTRHYINLSGGTDFQENLAHLTRDLYDAVISPPPLGFKPF